MLSNFDWIRRSQSGAELLATLRCLSEHPHFSSDEGELGPPHSALSSPCQRCWIYPRMSHPKNRDCYCKYCKEILAKKRRLSSLSRNSLVIWSFVNQLPTRFLKAKSPKSKSILGAYVHDENHFLVIIHKLKLKDWLQELAMYHGLDLRGLLQMFPTVGSGAKIKMGDILCIPMHQETHLPMDRLRIQFYSNPFQLLNPRLRERQAILTFEVAEFLSLLEMAEVFRTLLLPSQQKELYGLLQIEDHKEVQFYWGRFLGSLSQETKDMLTAWKIRLWPQNRIRLLYELVEYAKFH
jgi:hypothetical protein